MPQDNKESSNALQADRCNKIMLWLESLSSLYLIPMVKGVGDTRDLFSFDPITYF
jgi:hypothetical protein